MMMMMNVYGVWWTKRSTSEKEVAKRNEGNKIKETRIKH
jgi:hypothetical protein